MIPKNLFQILQSLAGLGLGCLVAAGCGQGLEPVSTLGDPTQAPSLSVPLALSPSSFSSYSSSSDGFTFGAILGMSVVAPASGLVVSVDTGSQVVVLLHQTRFLTKITGVQSSVPVGTYVYSGTQLGTVVGTPILGVRLSVIYNDVVACPLSWMSGAARTTISALTIANPCLN